MEMPVIAPPAPIWAVAVAPEPSPMMVTATSGMVKALNPQLGYGPK